MCRETKDRIVGFVHVKDLYLMQKGSTIDDLPVRTIEAVPESIPVAKLLQVLQEGSTKIAVVVDEHGGTAGIVTMTDIMEQIVGHVDDEYRHADSELVKKLTDDTMMIDGGMAVGDFVELIGFVPEDAEDCETLGGLIMDVLDRIPSEGESLTLEGKEATAKLTVVRMDRHRIDRVKLVLIPEAQARGRRITRGLPFGRPSFCPALASSGVCIPLSRRFPAQTPGRFRRAGFGASRPGSCTFAASTARSPCYSTFTPVKRSALCHRMFSSSSSVKPAVVSVRYSSAGSHMGKSLPNMMRSVAPHARELYRAALSQEELRAGFVKEHAIVHGHLVQDVVTHLVARPTAEMRRVHYQVGERAQDVHQAARVRVVVAVVARVDDHGQPQLLADGVHLHEARVVHVHLLRVGMQLDAAKAQLDSAL